MTEKAKKDFDFSDWLAEGLEGIVGSRPRIAPPMAPEFREHTKAAFREMLLAYRSLVDAAIAKTEKSEELSVTKIKIE
ncbi:MAG: hypothetical protein ACYC5O_18490 [Anaerolineae bacterium]